MNRILVPFLLAVLAALAAQAVARWMPRRNTLPALTSGAEAAPTRQAEDRAMAAARLPGVVALAFGVIMFFVLFRPSVALSGEVAFAIAVNVGLAAGAALLMFSALPAPKLPRALRSARTKVAGRTAGAPSGRTAATPSGMPAKPQRVGRRRTMILPAAVALAFTACLAASGLAASALAASALAASAATNTNPGNNNPAAAWALPDWAHAVPLMLVMVALAGSTLAAMERISTSPALPDPRMADLDRRWREVTFRAVRRFGTGAQLCYFGVAALLAGLSAATASGPERPDLALGLGVVGAGAAVAGAGVVLLVLAVKGVLTIRTAVRTLPEGATA